MLKNERMGLAKNLVKAIREADTIYEKNLLARLLCRLDFSELGLREGIDEIITAWEEKSGSDDVFEILKQKKRAIEQDQKEAVWQ